MRAGALAALLLCLLAWPPSATAASWLDEPITNWNVAGAAVPQAPPPEPEPYVVPDRCHGRERAAVSTEEQALADAGWLLEQFWPEKRSGSVDVIVAASEYDGMCRAELFNGFVFSGGQFAGTISPVNMSARGDGRLASGGVPAAYEGALTAAFDRYLERDPFCCPSGGKVSVRYRLMDGGSGPVLTPL